MRRKNTLRQGLMVAIAVSAIALPAAAEVNPFDGQWHFSITPYVWLPTLYVDATVSGRGGVASIDTGMHSSPNDYLKHLSFAAMITGEARKGDWSVFTDYIYLRFRDQETQVKAVNGPRGRTLGFVDAGSEIDLTGNVWTLAGSYTVWREGAKHVDVFAGFRYLGLDTDLDWRVDGSRGVLPGVQGSASGDIGKWDGIVGVKGQVPLSGDGRWFMPYYLDFGSGSNNRTWQALIAAGYRFDWGNVTLSLRSLSYDFSGQQSNSLDSRFTGLALGASFLF